MFAIATSAEVSLSTSAGNCCCCCASRLDAAERTPQKGGEMGWILETNTPMNRAMEGMGGEIKRRYRVYERLL